jgi:integral membrane protein (TIGR01906 family)
MKIGWLLGVLFVVSSFFLLLGVSFFGNAFSDAHYDFAQYSVEEKTAFSASLVNDAVVAYVSGSGDELLVDVFTADEVSHLSDVRAVVSVGRIMFMLSGVVFFLVLFSGYWVFGVHRLVVLRRLLLYAGVINLVFALLVISGIVFWFDGLFTAFHGLFFADGTWQFSSSSNLILLYPQTFFVDMGTAIMKTFLLGANFFIVLGGVLLALEKKWLE